MDASVRPYYIRRPCKPVVEASNLLKALKEILLVLLGLMWAVWGFFYSFTTMFTGKSLIAANTQQKIEPQQKLKALGETLAPESQKKKHRDDAEAPALVPRSWELVRQGIQGVPEVLAYDLAEDGSVVYTNGNGIYHIDANGRSQRVIADNLIESAKFIKQ